MPIEKITADAPESKSADVQADNVAKLKALFPDLVTEGKGGVAIDVNVLKQLVGDRTVTETEEKYGLDWHGKRKARQLALTPSTGTLRPCSKESEAWDTTRNLMIEGDNLEVIKLLQKSYAGRVKMIYIDPPYNTGNDFVYPDDFQDNIKNYLELTAQVNGGKKMVANTEASGRFHTDWLNMMLPRLSLLRNLLCEEGLLLMSIDDGEIHNSRLVLDSILGAENFIGSLIWEGGRKNDARLVSVSHDYILVYARNREKLRAEDTRWRERKVGLDAIYQKVSEMRPKFKEDYESMHIELLRWYKELPDGNPSKEHDHFSYVDKRGVYFPDNLRSPNPRPNLVYDWKGYKPHPNGWAYAKEKMAELDQEGRLCYPESFDQRIKIKSYLHEHEEWAPSSVFYKDRRASSKALSKLMGSDVFDYPKDVDVLARFIEAITDADDIILDCFAGSGSTGHAVMAINAARGSNRRFILVQLPEPLDPENAKHGAAIQLCTKSRRPQTIAELTKERLARASKKIREDSPLFHGDLGFRVYKLDSSNIREWDPKRDDMAATLDEHAEHLKTGRSETDILTELLLKLGLDLCVPIELRTISGVTVYSIGAGTLFACLSKAITRAQVKPLGHGILAWRAELKVAVKSEFVFRDSAFADDVAKTNLAAYLEQNLSESQRGRIRSL